MDDYVSDRARIIAHPEGDVIVATIIESRIVDNTNIDCVFDQVDKLVKDRSVSKLVLNMEKVQYLSSSALGRMMKLHKTLTSHKGALKLCSLQPDLAEIFKITRLDTAIKLYKDSATAVKSFQRRFGVFR